MVRESCWFALQVWQEAAVPGRCLEVRAGTMAETLSQVGGPPSVSVASASASDLRSWDPVWGSPVTPPLAVTMGDRPGHGHTA